MVFNKITLHTEHLLRLWTLQCYIPHKNYQCHILILIAYLMFDINYGIVTSEV